MRIRDSGTRPEDYWESHFNVPLTLARFNIERYWDVAELCFGYGTFSIPIAKATVVVHGAYWQDHDGAVFVLSKLKQHFQRLKVVFGDTAYGRNGLPDWVTETFGWVLQTALRPVGVPGFVVLPKRWIVERTFAWLAFALTEVEQGFRRISGHQDLPQLVAALERPSPAASPRASSPLRPPACAPPPPEAIDG